MKGNCRLTTEYISSNDKSADASLLKRTILVLKTVNLRSCSAQMKVEIYHRHIIIIVVTAQFSLILEKIEI